MTMASASHHESIVEWAVAGAPFEDEDESGDLHVVAPFVDGALIAVIDGLGHGPEAALAARAAARVLEARPTESLLELCRTCHEELRKTRGVVMSVASFDARSSTMAWVGVGNVEGVIVRARSAGVPRRESLATRGGVVGYNLPPLHVAHVSVSFGDVLVMATDGLRVSFSDDVHVEHDVRESADALLAKHAKGNDDALVLVARYLGRSA